MMTLDVFLLNTEELEGISGQYLHWERIIHPKTEHSKWYIYFLLTAWVTQIWQEVCLRKIFGDKFWRSTHDIFRTIFSAL